MTYNHNTLIYQNKHLNGEKWEEKNKQKKNKKLWKFLNFFLLSVLTLKEFLCFTENVIFLGSANKMMCKFQWEFLNWFCMKICVNLKSFPGEENLNLNNLQNSSSTLLSTALSIVPKKVIINKFSKINFDRNFYQNENTNLINLPHFHL